MDRRTLKNVLFPALTLGTAVIIVLMVASRKSETPLEIPLSQIAETRPMLLDDGSPVPLDAAFLLPSPIAMAKWPTATRFDVPLGSEQGAFTYDAQPFLTLNQRMRGQHLGDDLNGIGGRDTDLGDPVYAVGDGRVVFSGEAGPGWGKMVIVAHALPLEERESGLRETVQSVYAHLDETEVAAGMTVRRGDQIGAVGNADGAYFAHLHFEIRDSDSPDPSQGYAKDGALNRFDPTAWLAEHRNAAPDLLNPPPIEPVVLPQILIQSDSGESDES
ncbi:MAG: M23 family metallopeptidase [Verrucomicrobiota bacterium]